MSAATGLTSALQGAVLCLTLDRPRAANALDSNLQRALVQALAGASAATGVGAVLLAAVGDRVFSAGADLKEFSELDAGAARGLRRELLRASLLALAGFDKPLVAVVRGKAIGAGCMLALLADEVHAANEASFSLPEIRLGSATPVGAAIVAARGGRRAALHMSLSGEAVDAHTAHDLGLVDALHAADQLHDAGMTRARALAQWRGSAYAHNKRWINAGLCAEISRALDESARLQISRSP